MIPYITVNEQCVQYHLLVLASELAEIVIYIKDIVKSFKQGAEYRAFSFFHINYMTLYMQ